MNLIFRIAQDSAAEMISDLVNSVYRGEKALSQSWTTEASFLGGQRCDAKMIQDLISASGHVIILALDAVSNQLVGCVHLEQKGTTIYLGMLSVRLGHQNKGIASQLIKYCESFAVSSWGAKKIEMDVIHVRTELIEFYKRKGFHITDQRREFPYGKPRFGVPMRKDLYFIVMEKDLPANS